MIDGKLWKLIRQSKCLVSTTWCGTCYTRMFAFKMCNTLKLLGKLGSQINVGYQVLARGSAVGGFGEDIATRADGEKMFFVPRYYSVEKLLLSSG